MGLQELFYVASMPVIKVLIVSAIGLFLALDNINLLGKDARIQVNHLVHYVFNPALVGSNLADTITFENFLVLWFMPVNILGTFIIGSALGLILVKITRPPQNIEGLVIGACSAGNLGNLPIIILPAICKDKGSPFGDPDVCHKYGMGYASLSMAIGSIFIWSYVYNIMRISSSKVHKEGPTSSASININIQASGEILESLPNEFLEPQNSAKDDTNDAYTLLLSSEESEDKEKVDINSSFKTFTTLIKGIL